MTRTPTPLPTWMTAAEKELEAAGRVRPSDDPPTTIAPSGLRDLLADASDAPYHGADNVPITDLGSGQLLRDVLQRRRSTREFATVAHTTLGIVMARAGLSRSEGSDRAGIEISSRPTPSAGGRHPINLVLLCHDVTGLDAGGFVLDPGLAVLRRTRHSTEQCTFALERIADALHIDEVPPAVIVAVAHPLRTLSRYPEGMSLLWRDAGALLATIHLVATDLGLASCIVGTSGVLRTDHDGPLGPVDVGAVALGNPPHDPSWEGDV
jgi:SagB-type dehydrogenase family enzyme